MGNITERPQRKCPLFQFQVFSFAIFDSKDIYPSVKEKLSIKVVKFGEAYTNISDEDKRIINH